MHECSNAWMHERSNRMLKCSNVSEWEMWKELVNVTYWNHVGERRNREWVECVNVVDV